MGPPLVGLGVVLIFAGIFGFFTDNLGPRSKLWWPDRPAGYDRGRFIPPVFIGAGIVLIVVGGLTS